MHVPAPRVALVGREPDTAAITRRLMESPGRLVTVVGCGGIGKTTVALDAARRLEAKFPDGVWLADLSSVASNDAVATAIGRAVGLRGSLEGDTEAALIEFLRERKLLLVIDNCEHVIDACAKLADVVLDAAPGLHILATSREPLRITGEDVHTLDPLAVDPAAELFLSRVRRVRPDLPPADDNVYVAKDICRQLDGIPLAIELAATAARSMSLRDISQRVEAGFDAVLPRGRSRPERHQTMGAALAWSHDLLTSVEQSVFRRLGVLAGSWTLEAARHICAEPDVDAAIVGLVEKSLLVIEDDDSQARYRMLAPVREFAYAQLVSSGGVDQCRVRHCEYFVRQAELAEPELYGVDQRLWMRRLDYELDDLAFAVRTANERGDAENALRLVGGLWWFLWLRGYFRVGITWVEPALAVPGVPRNARMSGLRAAAMLAGALGDSAKASAYATELQTLAEEAADDAALSRAETLLGIEAIRGGDVDTARGHFESALERARRIGDSMMIGHGSVNLGSVLDGEAQQEMLTDALEHFESRHDAWGTAYAALSLAKVVAADGDHVGGAQLAARAVRLLNDLGDRFYVIFAAEDLARIVLQQRRMRPAAELFGWAGAVRRETGALLSPGSRDEFEKTGAELRKHLGDTSYEEARRAGAARPIDELLADALAPPKSDNNLTRREKDVVRLLAHGMTNREIAAELVITVGTTGIHVEHILRKLDLRSRHQVAEWAKANGLG